MEIFWQSHEAYLLVCTISAKRSNFEKGILGHPKNKNDIAQNALQWEWGNFPFANCNGICWGLPLQLVQLINIHFLPHLESFMWEWKFEKIFFKKVLYKPLMGCSLFSNSHFQMGVTVMGFAEHFRHSLILLHQFSLQSKVKKVHPIQGFLLCTWITCLCPNFQNFEDLQKIWIFTKF